MDSGAALRSAASPNVRITKRNRCKGEQMPRRQGGEVQMPNKHSGQPHPKGMGCVSRRADHPPPAPNRRPEARVGGEQRATLST